MFKLKRGLSAEAHDIRGHVAVQFALVAFPLIAGTTFILDYQKAEVERANLQAALDSAVIAAVNNDDLTLLEKEALAIDVFNRNYSGKLDIDLRSTAEENRVELSASGLSPVSVAAALGVDGIEVFQKSIAETAEENVICVLSLAEDGAERIKFGGNLSFEAPTCSVHANSTNSKAILSESTIVPVAKSFCTVGGAKGDFSPYAKGECRPIEDPYKDVKPATEDEFCLMGVRDGNKDDVARFEGDNEWSKDSTTEIVQFDPDSENVVAGSFVTLGPGTYCGGLNIQAANVKFEPGDYVIVDGKLSFKQGASAWGENVTFTMKGDKSKLKIESGSKVHLKAPNFGERKGLIFMEDVASSSGKDGKGIVKNEVDDGAEFAAIGTLYFPTQALVVKGKNARLGAQAPATSFIARELDFSGKEGSHVSVAVDHVAAGLPPVLPRAEDGARLVN